MSKPKLTLIVTQPEPKPRGTWDYTTGFPRLKTRAEQDRSRKHVERIAAKQQMRDWHTRWQR